MIPHSEKSIRARYTLALFKKFSAYLFSNPCGYDREHKVHYGLKNGSSDDIGIIPIVITQEMVGKKIGVFLSIEGKCHNWTPIKKEPSKGTAYWKMWHKEQKQFNWIKFINLNGGCAGIAKSQDEAEKIITDFIIEMES